MLVLSLGGQCRSALDSSYRNKLEYASYLEEKQIVLLWQASSLHRANCRGGDSVPVSSGRGGAGIFHSLRKKPLGAPSGHRALKSGFYALAGSCDDRLYGDSAARL